MRKSVVVEEKGYVRVFTRGELCSVGWFFFVRGGSKETGKEELCEAHMVLCFSSSLFLGELSSVLAQV